MKALSRDFFERPPLEAARVLLGKFLCVRQESGALFGGRIVEVEAYCGPTDKASHAKLTKRGGALVPTPRSAVMFGPAGHSYVYLIYGMHNCMNVVTHLPGPDGVGAVLLRALEPDPAFAQPPDASLRGPARLCSALGIDRRHNGLDMTTAEAPIFIADGPPVADAAVHAGPRIGVEYAGEDALLPYRLCIRASRHLSRPIVDSPATSKRRRTC